MFERRYEPLLPRRQFYRRMARSAGLGGLLVVASLVVGVCGYRFFEGFGWLDSFLNASMILAGMGPVGELHHPAAKIFASLYAIYSGIALISTSAVIFAPLVHRMIHRFHLEEDAEG